MADLTPAELFLLEWLAKEDLSAYGECYGAALDGLIAKGLAETLPDARGSFADGFGGVRLTDAGWAEETARRAP